VANCRKLHPGLVLEPLEREAARERERTHTQAGWEKVSDPGRALDRVAQAVGMSRPTLTKAIGSPGGILSEYVKYPVPAYARAP